ESGRLLAKQAIAVDVASPREYVEVEQIRFQPTGLKPNRLWISARALPTLSPPPAMLELVLPAERIEGFQGAKAGVFRGKLEKAGQSISLFADSLQLTEGSGEQGYVYLNVDDCPRAFVFRCTLPRQGDATTPVEDL